MSAVLKGFARLCATAGDRYYDRSFGCDRCRRRGLSDLERRVLSSSMALSKSWKGTIQPGH